jgi:hypothetical protein
MWICVSMRIALRTWRALLRRERVAEEVTVSHFTDETVELDLLSTTLHNVTQISHFTLDDTTALVHNCTQHPIKKLRGFSPPANYTDRATVAGATRFSEK